MEWQPIETAPDLERVVVAGWQEANGTTRGYWWYHEDVTDTGGVPIEHPSATMFVRLADILPTLPVAPSAP